MARMAESHNGSGRDAVIVKGRSVLIQQTCVIGRGVDSDVALNDPEVSRRHAMIVQQGDQCWINDMGSRNGVRINGKRLTHARPLQDGDRIQIGGQHLEFRAAPTVSRPVSGVRGPMTKLAVEANGSVFPGSISCEMITVGPTGEIVEGEKAARWAFESDLVRPFASKHSFLPVAVRAWLDKQIALDAAQGTPLELQKADRRVVVTLCRSEAGLHHLLVREDSPEAAAERLQALGLSQREAEVMRWVCEGKKNSDIATRLDVTIHTVNRHMEHIFKKLSVDNRQKAIVAVIERLGAD